MSIRQLLIPAILFLTFSNTISAQNSGFKYAYFAPDSLAGFDEGAAKAAALAEGAFGDDFTNFMNVEKRRYIIQKYDLLKPTVYTDPLPEGYIHPNANSKFGSNSTFAAPCVNEGFESGNITGWTASRGNNTLTNGSCTYPTAPLPVTFPTASLVTTSVTPFADQFYGFTVPNSPFTGSTVVRLNDNKLGAATNSTSGSGFELVRLRSNQFNVTTTNFLYEFAYMAVFLNPGHTCCQQPYMRVNLLDQTSNPIACPLFTFAPPAFSGTCASPGITWTNTGQLWRNPTWQRYAIDLTSYIGSQVSIEVNVSNCSLGGHWAYSYFDSNCGELGITLNNTTFYSAPSLSVSIPAICGQSATLTAPTGLGTYTWTGPAGSGITNNNNQTISTSAAGTYTLRMNPPGACQPINRFIFLSFPPPTTVTASPATLCASGGPSSSTLTATGASSYTWFPSMSSGSSIVVSPTVTTVYTVAVQTGTCIGARTIEVVVSPNPTLTVGNTNPIICAGGSSTLSANGALTYTWNPGGMTGSTVNVSPSSTTVYTVTGANASGCVDTETTLVTITTSPSITILFWSPASGSICAGSSIQLVGVGASDFTWMPTAPPVTGVFPVLSPTVTTTYTAYAGSGSCTNTAVKTVTVDQGPTMTVTASPTITCPGGSATLTAVAPTAVGAFTWNPGPTVGNPIVVSPTISTVYSVTARNANSCPRTYTINKLVAPVPTITILPATPTVCIGSAITLTATGGISYTWTSPAPVVNTNTRLVNPVVNTTYSVTASNGSCTSTSGKLVTVVANPTVTASASPTAVCPGASATLTGNGATTYTWMPGGSTGVSAVVTPAGNTTYTVTGNLAGCTSTGTVSVFINPLPTITVAKNPAAVCPGSCATLTPSGAQTYTYLNGGPVVCPTITTTYSVMGTSSLGCVSAAPGTTVVNVNPTPLISVSPAAPSVCAGGSVNVTASGAVSYTWMPGNTNGNSALLSPSVTTVYSITGANIQGCTRTRTVTVLVVPNPTVNVTSTPTAICRGGSATLSATGASSYTWFPGSMNGTPVNVSPTVTTTYTVAGRTSGCNDTTTFVLTVNPLPTITVAKNPSAVCPGFCSTLTPSGALTYTYLNGGPVVCPTITTTYSVTGTNAFGCVSAAPGTTVVNVFPTPLISVSPASPSICAGNSVNVTASGAVSYTWMPGNTNGNSALLSPSVTTIYTITGANIQGCTRQRTVTVLVVQNPTLVASASPASICSGASSTLSVSGAASYTWSPIASNSATVNVTPSSTTIYTVAGRTSGCSDTTTVSVTVNPTPTVSLASSTTAVCAGSCATLTPSGATSYTYLNGGPVVCPVVNTTYSVIGSSAFGCVSTPPATVAIAANPIPTVNVTASSGSICAGSSVTLTATGATAYTWTPGNLGGSSVVVSPSVTTTYTVRGSSAGCAAQNTITIFVVPSPTVNASASPATICRGASSTLTASGATSYTWMPGSLPGSSAVVSPTATTIYTVTGNTAGCAGTRTVQVTVNPLPTVTAVSSPTAVCAGSCATLSASGAASYTYSSGSPVVCPSVTTTYSVTGASVAGCVSANPATVTVVVNPLPVIVLTSTSPSLCAGSSASISASGAATYTWMPGNFTGGAIIVTPSVTTTYTVSGTSAAGCPAQSTITILVVPNPTVTATASPATICRGASSVLNASGANTYSWMPGSLSGNPVTVTPTVTTIYTVTGNTSGCTGTRTLAVTVNPLPTITAVANPTAVCPGFCSTLSVSGAATYTYINGGPVVCPSITTTYSISGTSALGCVSANPGTVTVIRNPAPVIFAVASSTQICAGSSATLTAGGATTYTWLPGNMSGSSVVVSPTTTTNYTVLGTAGCTGSAVISILVNPTPTITASASPAVICRGASALLTGSGAANYTWMPGNLTSNPVGVSPTVTTVYTVTGASSAGCVGTRTVMITVNPLPTITVVSSPTAICAGACATLIPSGAVSYTYSSGSAQVCPPATTIYSVTGTNAFGCVSAVPGTVNVIVNPLPVISLTSTSPSICAGSSATINATGANTYTWMPGNMSGNAVSVSPAVTTIYTVTGMSASGCVSQGTIQITVVPNPVVSAAASPATICRGGTSVLTASGASAYTWNPGSITSNPVGLTPTITTVYTVTGVSSGCPGTATVMVTVNPLPTITAVASNTSICAGSCVTLSASGAQTYTYSSGPVVCPSVTTTYSISGTNAFGCMSAFPGTVTVVVNPLPVISVTPPGTVICAGTNATVSASGASTYTWMPGNLSGASVLLSPASNTSYTVTGTLGSCTASAVFSIGVNPNPVISASALPAVICNGATSTLTASGASSYTWMPVAQTGSMITVTPNVNTAYIVTGENAFGCTGTQTVNVTVNPVPTVSISSTSATICSGTSATLTGSGAASYTWNPGSVVNASVAVSPASSTVYTLTGSNGFGCTDTTTFALGVISTPTMVVSASSPSVCEGFTTALSASGASSYTWNPGGLSGSAITVTPMTTTTYTVDGENGGCVSSATITILAVPLPTITASASPTVVCAGGTTTLSASGAATYTWLPMFTTGATVTDTPVASTIYTVAGFAANGCPNYTTVAVNVLPIPFITTASSSTAVCIGESATLTASGATNYTWEPGTVSGSVIVVSPTSTTDYTVTGDNGSCSNTATISLVVNPLPVITAAVSPTVVCEGSPVSLTATGGVSYTWSPIGLNGSTVTDIPLVSTTYTVDGEDANGCVNSAMVSVSVNPSPTLIATPSATALCEGSTVTLTASGALSFTWEPGSNTNAVITETPAVSTTYTLSGTDALGCVGSTTLLITVYPNPTVAVTPLNSSVCIGSSATLTATGASSYTWYPSLTTGSVSIETPTVATTYTVIGDNGGICFSTFTVDVFVNPLPANVTASASGTITCATPSVNLTGASTETTVIYSWNGPGGFFSGNQNPSGVTAWGIYTLTVTDTITGCSATATVDVPTDGSIPSVTATASGIITCANGTVTLNAANTTTNPAYSWTGPSGFTGTVQSVQATVAGSYTVTVTDLSSSCATSATVSVGSHTEVVVTASISPATCSAGVSNNDGTIMTGNFGTQDKFDLVAGGTYTGTATYSTALLIPTSGIITANLANPADTVSYTLRIFDSLGCQKDFVLRLIPVDCSIRSLGLAKSVSTPTTNADGSYSVVYSIVVKNYDSAALSQVVVTENLSSTFPLPTTFSVTSIDTSAAGTIGVNAGFNGSTQTNLTGSTGNIAAGSTHTISFTVKVNANGVFGPFSNTVSAVALNTINVVVADVSTDGLDPDPDGDKNPKNNNVPTMVTFTPNLFFGLTKQGAFVKSDNNSYDVTYTITVHNLGNDTLKNISVSDTLFGKTIRQPATYSIRSAPGASGGLVANGSFNGNSDAALLVAEQSRLAPGAVGQITFVINVVPDTVTVISNSANGNAFNALTGNTLRDISNNGTNPDSNGNGVWNEAEDNVPTVLVLPSLITVTHTLFIPEGFSPDNDGINDVFFIKGLPDTGDNTLTIFNRWGNRVYFHANYDNNWSGYPNIAGTMGRDKLPEGTYYYVLEMKGSGLKPVTGFIVLQYKN